MQFLSTFTAIGELLDDFVHQAVLGSLHLERLQFAAILVVESHSRFQRKHAAQPFHSSLQPSAAHRRLDGLQAYYGHQVFSDGHNGVDDLLNAAASRQSPRGSQHQVTQAKGGGSTIHHVHFELSVPGSIGGSLEGA